MQTTTLIKEHRCNIKPLSEALWQTPSHIFFVGSHAYPVSRLAFLKEFKGPTPPILWMLYNLYTIQSTFLKIKLWFSWWHFQDKETHRFFTPNNGSSFFPPLFFSLQHVVYTVCSYIPKHSFHWIPFSCLPGSFLNHSQFSPARITGWC